MGTSDRNRRRRRRGKGRNQLNGAAGPAPDSANRGGSGPRRERNTVPSLPGAAQRAGERALPGSTAPQDAAAQALDPLELWAIVRSRKRLVLGVAAVVFLAVALGTWLQDPAYRASGTIEFRKHAGDVAPLDVLVEMARIPDQHLETQYGLLRSPALARRVAAELGLRNPGDFTRQPAATRAGMIGRGGTSERVISAFGKRLRVEPLTDSRMVRVSFEAGDPVLAAAVVNAIFSNYVTLRMETARSTIDRLDVQVDSVRAAVARAEERLQHYALANELMFFETGDGQTENMVQERLRQLQQQLTEAEAERYVLESRHELVQRRNFDALASDVLRTLSVRVAEMQGEYARLRTTFTDNYPRTREVKRQLDELTAQLGRERSRIAAGIRGEYMGAVRRQELLQQAFDRQKELADTLAARSAEYRILKRDLDGHQQLYSVLQQKQKEASVALALAPAEISVVDTAVPPEEPVRPAPERNLPLGAVAGLLLGVGVAFLRHYTDPALRSVDEVDASGTVPILGLIPAMRSSPAHGMRLPPRLRTVLAPTRLRALLPPDGEATSEEWVRIDRHDLRDSPLAEAFSGLRTSVLLNADGPLPKSLLVTSGQPGEGKTTIAVNLALSMARLGRRVLLVDADIRRPSVHRAFRLPTGRGLSEYLAGDGQWRDLVRRDVFAGLDILAAGAPPDRPSELLSSGRMRSLLGDIEAAYDVVIIDSPAMLVNVPDARILAPLVEGVVLVVRSGVTPRSLLRRMTERAPNIMGVVVNDLDPERLPDYYGRYAERTAEASVSGDEGGAAAVSKQSGV